MRVFGLWYGGSSYACPGRDDLEEFRSIAQARAGRRTKAIWAISEARAKVAEAQEDPIDLHEVGSAAADAALCEQWAAQA